MFFCLCKVVTGRAQRHPLPFWLLSWVLSPSCPTRVWVPSFLGMEKNTGTQATVSSLSPTLEMEAMGDPAFLSHPTSPTLIFLDYPKRRVWLEALQYGSVDN